MNCWHGRIRTCVTGVKGQGLAVRRRANIINLRSFVLLERKDSNLREPGQSRSSLPLDDFPVSVKAGAVGLEPTLSGLESDVLAIDTKHLYFYKLGSRISFACSGSGFFFVSLYFCLLALGSQSQQLQYTRSCLIFLFDLLIASTTGFEPA